MHACNEINQQDAHARDLESPETPAVGGSFTDWVER